MPLPESFSEWEHLQSTLRIYHNKLVREEFSDIEADDLLDIPRGSLKIACLLKDDDTVDMTILRLYLLFFHARKAADLQPAIYGTRVEAYNANITYQPQVNLFFKEDDDQVAPGRQAVQADLSFRLTNETQATITEADARTLATKIKSEFGAAGGYRWRKGKLLVTYKNPQQGANFQIYAFSESEAREVMTKLLELRGHTLDNDFVVIHESKATFSANPGTHLVYGKSRQKPVRRPTTYVRFVRATLHVWGMSKGVTLYDRTGYFPGLVNHY
jgi:hypothetical protein